MLLRLNNPLLVPDLLGHLRSGIDVVAAQVSEDEVLVGFLGSRGETSQRLELQSRLAGWLREHPEGDVLLPDAA
jgi:hypothetical protein